MSTPTFEEAVSAAQQGDAGVAHIKETVFAEPLSELKRMKSEWARTHAELQGRIARARGRMQQAVDAGLNFDHVARLGKPFLDRLTGDGLAHPGVLNAIGPQIDRSIASMENFTVSQLHNERHVWCAWPNIPSRVRDNINGAESLVGQLEAIVADGGQLQQMIEQVAERKAGSQAVA